MHSFSATAIDTKIYVLGGKTREDTASFTIQCYDTTTSQTTTTRDLPVPVALSGAITVGRTIYLATGAGDIIKWTPEDGGYIIKTVLKRERKVYRGSRLFYYDRKIIVFSTFDGVSTEDERVYLGDTHTMVENCCVDLDSGDIQHPWLDVKDRAEMSPVGGGHADKCSMHVCIAPKSFFLKPDDDDNESNTENNTDNDD